MTTAHVTADTLQIRFSRGEKIAGLIRDIDLPLATIRDVQVVPDGLAATRGLRTPGLGLPGYRMIATWRAAAARRSSPSTATGPPSRSLPTTPAAPVCCSTSVTRSDSSARSRPTSRQPEHGARRSRGRPVGDAALQRSPAEEVG
jgi:hypothetical protein